LHGSTAHENHVSADGQLLQLGHRAGADSAGASLHGAAREVDHRHLAGTGAQPKKPRPFATAAPPLRRRPAGRAEPPARPNPRSAHVQRLRRGVHKSEGKPITIVCKNSGSCCKTLGQASFLGWPNSQPPKKRARRTLLLACQHLIQLYKLLDRVLQ